MELISAFVKSTLRHWDAFLEFYFFHIVARLTQSQTFYTKNSIKFAERFFSKENKILVLKNNEKFPSNSKFHKVTEEC